MVCSCCKSQRGYQLWLILTLTLDMAVFVDFYGLRRQLSDLRHASCPPDTWLEILNTDSTSFTADHEAADVATTRKRGFRSGSACEGLGIVQRTIDFAGPERAFNSPTAARRRATAMRARIRELFETGRTAKSI